MFDPNDKSPKMNWGTALLWGAVIITVLFTLMYVGYFAIEYFLAMHHS